MAKRNSMSHRFARLFAFSGGIATSAIVALTALAVGSGIGEETAAATHAAALTLGGLLLAAAIAARHGSKESSRQLLEFKRAHVRPHDSVDDHHHR